MYNDNMGGQELRSSGSLLSE